MSQFLTAYFILSRNTLAFLSSLCLAWRERLSFLIGELKGEDGTDSDVGTEGNAVHFNFHYFSAGILVSFMKKYCEECYSLNRMTEEIFHEERPLFGTENKIFQDFCYYT